MVSQRISPARYSDSLDEKRFFQAEISFALLCIYIHGLAAWFSFLHCLGTDDVQGIIASVKFDVLNGVLLSRLPGGPSNFRQHHPWDGFAASSAHSWFALSRIIVSARNA